jgi:hypothetical protein
MTTRNLNRTWRDVVFKQYEADLEANAPFPIRYFIYAISWQRDIIIRVLYKITLEIFRKSIFTFFRTLHNSENPTYEDDNLSVRPRQSPTSAINDDTALDEIDNTHADASPCSSS